MLQLGELINFSKVIIVLYFFIFILLCASLIAFFLLKKIYVPTSTMAAVMSLGIITQGVLSNFFGIHSLEKILSVINFALWSSFSFSILMTFFNKKFREIHYSNPINRFGIGTWVAGTSICTILIAKQFTEWALIAKIISYFNFCLWFFYVLICIQAFFELNSKRLSEKVHGILLLTTVSTQSLVLVMSSVYKKVPIAVDHFFIMLGLCFYLISAFIIVKRYLMKSSSWSIEKDWNNTNCILHGALSITGLACIRSQSVNEQVIIAIWVCAATIFVIVESIEIYRMYKRMKSLGLKTAIFIYDLSQWSRVFTFGMFFTFTYMIAPGLSALSAIQKIIITIGIWAVPCLLILEVCLCANHLLQFSRNYPKQYQKNSELNA
ncbi:hypothetical protein E2K98_17795 [Bacillus salipaludis]|uniref:Voltage-dependent anion channel n=1 Tax=Bacillus salipaludis TaxID=2547811 RepID=A0A4R5VNF0_9BACI|nr:hypothetical protein E2K98_17795 [Bacillus salipaludis]